VVGETNSTNRVGTTNVYVGPASGGPWTSIGQLEFTTSAPYTKEIQLDIPVETRYLRLYITKTADNNGSMYNSNTLLFNRVYVYGSNLSAQ
jgi:hypothetical protein